MTHLITYCSTSEYKILYDKNLCKFNWVTVHGKESDNSFDIASEAIEDVTRYLKGMK